MGLLLRICYAFLSLASRINNIYEFLGDALSPCSLDSFGDIIIRIRSIHVGESNCGNEHY